MVVLESVLKSYLEYLCGKSNVRENVQMRNHTTFKIGGPARFFIKVTNKTMLVRLISALNFIEYPYRVIGSGSNLLVGEKGFGGVIIRLTFNDIVENGNFIYADAGAILSTVSKKAAELGLGGLEFLCGIPGTVGGAICGNAGAFGGCIATVVPIVDVLINGEIISMDTIACKFEYRTSIFKKKRDIIILGAYFSLRRSSRQVIEKKQKEYLELRASIQPQGACAGSIFHNPPGQAAGQLIDRLGLKGTRIGGAVVSEKHANFIMNECNATAGDVIKLIKLIKKRVRDTYSIKLKNEIEFLNC